MITKTNETGSVIVADVLIRIREARDAGYRQGYAVGTRDGRDSIRRRNRLMIPCVLFAGLVGGAELMLLVAASGVVR